MSVVSVVCAERRCVVVLCVSVAFSARVCVWAPEQQPQQQQKSRKQNRARTRMRCLSGCSQQQKQQQNHTTRPAAGSTGRVRPVCTMCIHYMDRGAVVRLSRVFYALVHGVDVNISGTVNANDARAQARFTLRSIS